MSNGGATTMICVAVTELTKASLAGCPLPGSKSTRTGWRKFVPVITTCWPPAGIPVAGVVQVVPVTTQTEVIVGVVFGGGVVVGTVVKVTDVVLETLFTVAVIVAVPTLDEVSVAVATPPVVVRMVVFVPVSENVPIVVVNCTAVPSGTAEPFCVTVAVTFTCELTSGLAFETVSAIVAPLGGVTPPGGTVEVVGGAVGDDSPLQPIIVSARRATRAISRMRSVVVFMSKPPTLPALRAAGAVEAE